MNKKGKRKYVFWGILLLVIFLGAREYYWESKSIINYRITVTMQTPTGDVSGSTVRAVKLPTRGLLIDLPEANPKIKSLGEAVIIDLSEKGKVFALIDDASKYELMYTFNFRSSKNDNMYKERIAFYNNYPKEEKKDLPLHNWPKMVWFEDINDPKSVKLVHTTKENPENNREWIQVDNAADLFGEGYAVKSMTVEITDKPVTFGHVKKILPWILKYKGQRMDGSRFGTSDTTYPLANSLSAGSFTTGE
jgi:hypothetical protein